MSAPSPDPEPVAAEALMEAVENLLTQPVFVGDEGFTPTLTAVSAGHLAVLRRALDAARSAPPITATAREALLPFAEFADPRGAVPPDHIITQGSSMARRQLTMGDCYKALAALPVREDGPTGIDVERLKIAMARHEDGKVAEHGIDHDCDFGCASEIAAAYIAAAYIGASHVRDTDRAEYDPFGDRISVVQEPPGWSGDTDRAVEAGLRNRIAETIAVGITSQPNALGLTWNEAKVLGSEIARRIDLSGSPRSDTALDVAWREAEAALPEGWDLSLMSLRKHVDPAHDGPELYAATASAPTDVDHPYTQVISSEDGRPRGSKHDATPAAALHALAARLSSPTPEREQG